MLVLLMLFKVVSMVFNEPDKQCHCCTKRCFCAKDKCIGFVKEPHVSERR
jgi:hypothetical protein